MAKISYSITASVNVSDELLDHIEGTFNCSMTGEGAALVDLADLEDGIKNGDWEGFAQEKKILQGIVNEIRKHETKSKVRIDGVAFYC